MKQKKQPDKSEKGKAIKDIYIHVDAFGQIVRDVRLEDINAFLNDHVPDKKLEDNDAEKTT